MEKFYFIKTLFLLPQIGFSHLISDVFLTVYYASKVHKTKSKHSQKIIFSGPYKKPESSTLSIFLLTLKYYRILKRIIGFVLFKHTFKLSKADRDKIAQFELTVTVPEQHKIDIIFSSFTFLKAWKRLIKDENRY